MDSTAAPAPALATPGQARRARGGVGLVFFVSGASFSSWVSRIPALRDGLHLSNGTLGSVLFALSLGVLLAFPLTGRGTQWLGARTLALLAGVLTLLLLPAPFLVNIVPSLILVMLEMGAANGALQVSMNVLAVEVQAFVGRPIMSSLHGLWSLGGLAGAAAGSLAAHAALSPTVHLLGVSVFLGVVLLLAAWLLRGLPLQAPVLAQADLDQVAPPRRFAGLDRVLVGLGVVCFCAFLTEGALADWSAVYLREKGHASEAVAALGYAAFTGAMTTMRLVGDRVTARFGLVRTLRLFNALGVLALATALALHQVGVAMAAFALMGLGLATVVPSAFVAAARHVESVVTPAVAAVRSARAIALVSGFGYTGLLVGPPLIGWLAQASSLSWALGLLLLLVSAIVALAPLLQATLRDARPRPASRVSGRVTVNAR